MGTSVWVMPPDGGPAHVESINDINAAHASLQYPYANAFADANLITTVSPNTISISSNASVHGNAVAPAKIYASSESTFQGKFSLSGPTQIEVSGIEDVQGYGQAHLDISSSGSSIYQQFLAVPGSPSPSTFDDRLTLPAGQYTFTGVQASSGGQSTTGQFSNSATLDVKLAILPEPTSIALFALTSLVVLTRPDH